MLKLSNKQKEALEKITGKHFDSLNFSPEAIESYFAYTDRGEKTPLFERVWRLQLPGFKFTKVEQDLWDIMQYHTFHPVTVEMWKKDFCSNPPLPPLLFLWDFYEWNEDKKLISEHPDSYLKHVFEVYLEARGSLMIDDYSLVKEWADRLGVKYTKEIVDASSN
jgi:hypothetical protein